MSKRKALDKEQARERRDRLLESAAAARLPLADGVREMRAISGLTQEEFARHRGVSARVIKAIELDQGNPTVATMNRIGQFFGLEVGFVPIRRDDHVAEVLAGDPGTYPDLAAVLRQMNADFDAKMRELTEIVLNGDARRAAPDAAASGPAAPAKPVTVRARRKAAPREK